MAPMPNNKNANINKLFGKIDNINSKEQYDRLHVPINIKDENGDSILHHILIHALDEEQALMKIKSIDKIETLINTTNKKGQTPMHLICKYQYYDTFNYIVDKCEHKLEPDGPEEFKLIEGNINIEGGAKDEEIKINYIAFDNKRKTPFNYLLHGVLHNKSNDKTNVLKEFNTDAINSFNDFTELLNNNLQICFDNNDINIRIINKKFIDDYISKIGKKMHLLMNTYVDNRQLNKFIDKNNKFIHDNNKIISIIKHLFNKNIIELQNIRYNIYLKDLQQLLPTNNSQNAIRLFSLLPYVPKTYLMFLYTNIRILLTLHKDEINTLLSLNDLNLNTRTIQYKEQLEYIQCCLCIKYLRQYLDDIPMPHSEIVGTYDSNVKNKIMKIADMLKNTQNDIITNDENKNTLFNKNYSTYLKTIINTKIPTKYLILQRLDPSTLNDIKENISNIEELTKDDNFNFITNNSYKNELKTILIELSNDVLNHNDIINKIIDCQKALIELINDLIPLLYLNDYKQLTKLYELLTAYMNKNGIDIFNDKKITDFKVYDYFKFPLVSMDIGDKIADFFNKNDTIILNDDFEHNFNNYTFDYIDDNNFNNFIVDAVNSLENKTYNLMTLGEDKVNYYKDKDNNLLFYNSDDKYYEVKDITVDGDNLILNKFGLQMLLGYDDKINTLNINSNKIICCDKINNIGIDINIDQDIYLPFFHICIRNTNIYIYLDSINLDNTTYVDFYDKSLVKKDSTAKNPTIYKLNENLNVGDYNTSPNTVNKTINITKKDNNVITAINNILKLTDINNFSEINNNDINDVINMKINDIKNTNELKSIMKTILINDYGIIETLKLDVSVVLNENNFDLKILLTYTNNAEPIEQHSIEVLYKFNINNSLLTINENIQCPLKCKQLNSNYSVLINYNENISRIILNNDSNIINMSIYKQKKIHCMNQNDYISITYDDDIFDDKTIIDKKNENDETINLKNIFNDTNYHDTTICMTIKYANSNITINHSFLIKASPNINECTELSIYNKDNCLYVFTHPDNDNLYICVKKIYLYAYLLTLNKLGIHNNYINHEYFNSISTIFDDINDVVTNNLMKTYEDIKLKLLQKFQSEKIDKIII